MLNVVMLNVVMLNVIMLNVAMLGVVILSIVMLSVIMLSVAMLNVVILSVIMLSVTAPVDVEVTMKKFRRIQKKKTFQNLIWCKAISSTCHFVNAPLRQLL
jgi:hypothetical protein